MKLKFKLKDEKHINIINEKDGRIVGRIFTPSGTSRDKPDAIQICGFSRAFMLWGCGAIGDNNNMPLQDIQLLFKDFKSKKKDASISIEKTSIEGTSFPVKHISNECWRCFHKKDEVGNCKCSELKVHRTYEDIAKWEKRRENYETKAKIIKNLK